MPRHPKSAIDQLKTWTIKRLARILWVSGIVAGLSGAIVGGAKAWPIIEPIWYTSHGYLREYHTPDHIKLLEIQLRYNEKERAGLIEETGKLELDLQSPANKTAPQYRALIQQRIDQIKQELDSINQENKSLRDEKAK